MKKVDYIFTKAEEDTIKHCIKTKDKYGFTRLPHGFRERVLNRVNTPEFQQKFGDVILNKDLTCSFPNGSLEYLSVFNPAFRFRDTI